MIFLQLLMMLADASLVVVAGYSCRTLLKSAQYREDAEDERIWDYLLNPRTL